MKTYYAHPLVNGLLYSVAFTLDAAGKAEPVEIMLVRGPVIHHYDPATMPAALLADLKAGCIDCLERANMELATQDSG